MSLHRSLLWGFMLLTLQLGSCVGISATIARAESPAATSVAAVDRVQ
jgi:hypothetical protein